MSSRTSIYGVGINDADYVIAPKVSGRQVVCHFYSTWKSMFVRSYSKKYHSKQPTYVECSVADDWHRFSEFRKWMINQAWDGMALDKDILCFGNLVYSSETCVFVPRFVNNCFAVGSRKGMPFGVCAPEKMKESPRPFSACGSDRYGKTIHLGHYSSAKYAHAAWQVYKIQSMRECLDKYSSTANADARVSTAIAERILRIEKSLAAGVETTMV